MDKLIFKKAKVKNFLTYGNDPQTIEFASGMTLITGTDEGTHKSNGSGKTSVTEVIPFALFGKTIKDVPQSDIINWNNRTNCSVELYFDKGNDSYRIKRQLKPNKLRLFKNDEEMISAASVRDFQLMIEDDIIGMDFKTFKNLIHYSPNNTISIIGAKKEQKRQFLESLFDLSDYSGMLKVVNTKISEITKKNMENEITISHLKDNVHKIKEEIQSSKELDTSGEKKKLKELEFTLEVLKESKIIDVSTELSLFKEHVEDLISNKNKYDIELSGLNATISTLEKSIKSGNIDKMLSKKSEIEDNIKKRKDAITEAESKKQNIPELQDELSSLEDSLKTTNETKQTKDKEVHLRQYVIKSCDENIGVQETRTEHMSGKASCDFCGSDIDPSKLNEWSQDIINKEKQEKQKHTDIINKLTEEIIELENKERDLYKLISDIKNTISLQEKIDRMVSLATKEIIRFEEDIVNITENINNYENNIYEINDIKKKIDNINWKRQMIVEDLSDKQIHLKDLEKIDKTFQETNSRINILNSDISNMKESLAKLEILEKDRLEKIKKKGQEVIGIVEDIKNKEKDIKSSHIIQDHLEYMKVSLKDENVKQFAISSFLPYLNQQANYYLSESGFPYTIRLDGWLDVLIMGLGSDNINYKSLSGGETKALDMAVQLACNDIAELQAKTTLSVSIYDEILDTSLDDDGVEKVMNIIGVKQQNNSGCVLVITHKSEIKSFDFDRYINVCKRDGFSIIE